MNRQLLSGLLVSTLLACNSSGGGKPNQGTGGAGANGGGGTTASGGSGGSTSPSGGAGGGNAGGSGGSVTAGTTGSGGIPATGGSGGVPASGGSVGTGGTGGGPAAGTSGMNVDTSADVLERNKHPSRDGAYVQPTLTKANAAKMALDFMNTFSGGVWAAPLYISNGPKNKGAYFVVTTSNDVLAFDDAGAPVMLDATHPWKANIGAASANTGAGCGDGPIGISSTPVIDAAARTIYVAGGVSGGGNGVSRHEVHAYSIDDATERAGWPVVTSGMTFGTKTLSPGAHNQRGALSLVNGILYVPYGGYNGDCNNYAGWVIAINTKTPATKAAWATGGGRGSAIWAQGGMASDGTSVFAVTGNNFGDGAHVDSEEIVRLTGMSVVDRDTGIFWPSSWQDMDGGDGDLGGSSSVYFELPSATPSTLVATIAKDGHLYVVNSKKLGGMGGSVADLRVANDPQNGGDNSAKGTPASYTTSKGRYIIVNGGGSNNCGGNGTGHIASVLVTPGSPPTLSVAFCTGGGTNTSAMATTTDGKSEAIVWYINGGKLTGVDGDTGASVFAGGTANCGVRKWTSPIAVNGHIVTVGDGHLCSWSAH